MTRPGSSSCGTSSAHDDLEHDRATGKLVVRVRHENKSHTPRRRQERTRVGESPPRR